MFSCQAQDTFRRDEAQTLSHISIKKSSSLSHTYDQPKIFRTGEPKDVHITYHAPLVGGERNGFRNGDEHKGQEQVMYRLADVTKDILGQNFSKSCMFPSQLRSARRPALPLCKPTFGGKTFCPFHYLLVCF